MSNISPFNPLSSQAYMETLLAEDATPDVGDRFLQGFKQLLEERKQQAVLALVQEEFPHLAEDTNFVKRVVERLDSSDIIEEKRFVFLSLNPKYKK